MSHGFDERLWNRDKVKLGWILISKFRLEKVKVYVVVTYGSSEGDIESETGWGNLNDVMEGESMDFQIYYVDLNKWLKMWFNKNKK